MVDKTLLMVAKIPDVWAVLLLFTVVVSFLLMELVNFLVSIELDDEEVADDPEFEECIEIEELEEVTGSDNVV